MFFLQDPSESSDWLNHPQVLYLEKNLFWAILYQWNNWCAHTFWYIWSSSLLPDSLPECLPLSMPLLLFHKTLWLAQIRFVNNSDSGFGLLASNVSFETLPTDPPSGFIVLSVELLACWGVLTRLQTSTTSPVWMELNNFFWRAGLRWALATQGGL